MYIYIYIYSIYLWWNQCKHHDVDWLGRLKKRWRQEPHETIYKCGFHPSYCSWHSTQPPNLCIEQLKSPLCSSYLSLLLTAIRLLVRTSICLGTLPLTLNQTWLVVDLPLWKIWKSVGNMIPNIWKSLANHQPEYLITVTILNHY